MSTLLRQWRPRSPQLRLKVGQTSTLGPHRWTRHSACTRAAVEAPVCIVTGGARGIGRAIATMLGATGAKVKLAARLRKAVFDTAERLNVSMLLYPSMLLFSRTLVRLRYVRVLSCLQHIASILQVVVNYASSSGPADEVAQIIKESGGEAITIGADISKPDEVDRCCAPGLYLMYAECFNKSHTHKQNDLLSCYWYIALLRDTAALQCMV